MDRRREHITGMTLWGRTVALLDMVLRTLTEDYRTSRYTRSRVQLSGSSGVGNED